MADCLFCKIRDGVIPAKVIYEDDRAVAFNDIHPQAPLHALIISRKHIPSLLDLTPEDEADGHRPQRLKTALTVVPTPAVPAEVSQVRRTDAGLQPRRRADRVAHPSARARRPRPQLAAGVRSATS